MPTISLHDAQINLFLLIEQIATGAKDEITITRNGSPVARVLPIAPNVSRRIGLARGEFEVPDDIDRHNAEVAGQYKML